jgi:hypothetical protein
VDKGLRFQDVSEACEHLWDLVEIVVLQVMRAIYRVIGGWRESLQRTSVTDNIRVTGGVDIKQVSIPSRCPIREADGVVIPPDVEKSRHGVSEAVAQWL